MNLPKDKFADIPLNYGGTPFVVLYNPVDLKREVKEIISKHCSPSMVEEDGDSAQYNIDYLNDILTDEETLAEENQEHVEELRKFVDYCVLQGIAYVEIDIQQ